MQMWRRWTLLKLLVNGVQAGHFSAQTALRLYLQADFS